MLDGLRAVLRWDWFSPEVWGELLARGDVIQRVCPRTGEMRWQSPAWEQERSDQHQVSVRVNGTGLVIWGSPARCLGDGCAVFGVGPSAGEDLAGCLWAMVSVAEKALGVALSREVQDWRVVRVDVTRNFLLDGAAQVREALAYLRGTSGGRYRVAAAYTESVYWSTGSRIRAGKAYAKGPHLAWAQKRKDYSGRVYSLDELTLLDSVLRFELELRRDWWRAVGDWWRVTAADLAAAWDGFFGRMLGAVMVSVDSLRDRVVAAGITPGVGRSAWSTWCLIQAMGFEGARESVNRRTWYRHLKVLRVAGLSDADLSAGRVVPLRRSLVLRPVSSWGELRRAA